MDPRLIEEMREIAAKANALMEEAAKQGITQDQYDMESYRVRELIIKEMEALSKKYGFPLQRFMPGANWTPIGGV